MNLGIDFHDTLSYSPKFFRKLASNWCGKIYIVTGTPASYRDDVANDLELLGFSGLYEDILMGYEYDKKDMSTDHFKKMREHKLKLIKGYDIQVYFDDNPYYAHWMKDNGVLTFMLCIDQEYMDRFAKADPFFTCHLQGKVFDFLKHLENKDVVR